MNKHIVVSVVIVTVAGVANAYTNKKPITPVIIGSYVFFFLVSILDMYGGPFSTFAGAIAMLAATYIVINEFPWKLLIDLTTKPTAGAQSAVNSNQLNIKKP